MYVGIFVGAALLGYREMAPDRLTHIHPTILSGCVFAFLLTSIGFLLAMRYAATQCAKFSRPSWHRRFPFIEWRYDPLQFLCLCALIAFGLLLGSLSRLPSSGPNGFWMVVFFSCLFLGELTGILLGCLIYRSHVRTDFRDSTTGCTARQNGHNYLFVRNFEKVATN